MNRDEVIHMAREVGICIANSILLPAPDGEVEALERFFQAAYAAGAAAEREACAQILDRNADVCANSTMLADVLRSNADAIRARSKE